MGKKRAFISFDYDHDEDLRTMLAGQALHPDSPFEFADRSLKEPLLGDWKEKVRRRMANIDVVIVICGEWTHAAKGVATELDIARQESKPYFLLAGRSEKHCTRPTSAAYTDKLYRWTVGQRKGVNWRESLVSLLNTIYAPYPLRRYR